MEFSLQDIHTQFFKKEFFKYLGNTRVQNTQYDVINKEFH